MIRTQIQLSEADHDRLREIAAQLGRSMADCIREGIELFLQRACSPDVSVADAPSFQPLPIDDLKDHDRWWAAEAAGSRPPADTTGARRRRGAS